MVESLKRRTYPVFVYGTLKSGGRLHQYLQGYDFVGKGELIGWDMFRSASGWFPAIERGTKTVKGEVWAVPIAVFDKLDEIEAVPHLHVRSKQPIRMENGVEVRAYVYHAQYSLRGLKEIKSGEWTRGDEANSDSRVQ